MLSDMATDQPDSCAKFNPPEAGQRATDGSVTVPSPTGKRPVSVQAALSPLARALFREISTVEWVGKSLSNPHAYWTVESFG